MSEKISVLSHSKASPKRYGTAPSTIEAQVFFLCNNEYRRLRGTYCLCLYLEYSGNRFPLKHGHLYTRLHGVTSRITILMFTTAKIYSITNTGFAIPFLKHRAWLPTSVSIYTCVYVSTSLASMLDTRQSEGEDGKWGTQHRSLTNHFKTVVAQLAGNFVSFQTTEKKGTIRILKKKK